MRISIWKKIIVVFFGVLICVSSFGGCDALKRNDESAITELAFEESETAGIDYNRFTDVVGHPAESYIKALSLLGIARGRTDTKFAPDENITRAEFTEMVAYAAGLTASSYTDIYTDVTASMAYADILQAAHTAGLIDTKFVSNDTFDGNDRISREEVASMLSAGYKLVTGENTVPDTISQLTSDNPKGTITRADAVKLVYDLQDTSTKMFQWGFDNNLSGWSPILRTAATTAGKTNAKGTAAWSPDDGHNAPGCMLFDLVYTGMNQVNSFWWQYNVAGKNGRNVLTKGQSYLLTFYVKVEGDADDAVDLNIVKFRNRTDDSDEYSNLGSASLTGEGWQFYCIELTATSTVRVAQLIFQAGGCDNFNTKIYIDDIALQAFDKKIGIRAAAETTYTNLSAISGSGSYYQGETAVLVAGGRKINEEYYLPDTWTDNEYGNVVGLGSLYSNTVTKHRAMEVAYQKFSVPEKGWNFTASGYDADILLSNVSRDAGSVSVDAKLCVPQGYSLIDVGVLYYNGSYAENFSIFTEGATLVRPDTIAADGTFRVSHSGYADIDHVLMKGYAICKDEYDNYIVFYGNDQLSLAEINQANISAKMIYNLEMLYCFVDTLGSNETAWNEIVKQIATTDADMITLTPQACRTNLWLSEVDAEFMDPVWKDLDPSVGSSYYLYERMKKYCEDGNDPLKVMLELFRNHGFDTVFVDYRMNEAQNTSSVHAFHNTFYLEHKEYWLNPDSPLNDRVFNYMESEVREYYFRLVEELVTNYDVDGLSLDFERHPIFFKNEELDEGTQVMTDFIGRIRAMLDRVGKAKGKYLPLGVRVCSSMEKSLNAGLDIAEWVERGYIDYVNATSTYYHTPSVDIESYREVVGDDVKVYGELHFAVYEQSNNTSQRVYTTDEGMKSVAESFFARGADGISAFNMDYSENVPATLRSLTGIIDPNALVDTEKHYVLKRGFDFNDAVGIASAAPYLAVDSSKFDYALLRIRTNDPCKNSNFTVSFNDQNLNLAETINLTDKSELFPRIVSSTAHATLSYVKYYVVPLDLIKNGVNSIEVKQTSGESCKVDLIDIGIYHEDSYALQGEERTP